MATAYQKRMALRKNSDLTRLAEQYKKNLEATTGQYEASFAAYQKQRDELMAPYEAAVKKYKEVDMPAYESAAEAYRQRLEQYNQALADYEANPREKITNSFVEASKFGTIIQIGNKVYGTKNLPAEYSVAGLGAGAVYRDRPMPKAPSGAPSAPQAPTAPQIAGFDESQFQQKRQQLQTEFQRETGERRNARLAAVGRRASRPLLKDA